jgi:hypothetical protein
VKLPRARSSDWGENSAAFGVWIILLSNLSFALGIEMGSQIINLDNLTYAPIIIMVKQ